MGTTKFCIASCAEFVGSSQKLNSACLSYPNSAYSSLSSAWRLDSAAFTQSRSRVALRASFTPISVRVSASSATGVPNDELEASSIRVIGASDLLIVGPGVLGRIVAEIWRKEHPGSQVYGQTLTTDHHDELIKLGISPCLKGTQVTHKFPYVISVLLHPEIQIILVKSALSYCLCFLTRCEVLNGNYEIQFRPRIELHHRVGKCKMHEKEATLKWNGEGSFLFTSSSANYDCSDNGYCDEDAASLAITILKRKLHGRIFLGCDNNPLSRQEVMELVNKSGKYNQKFEGFTGTTGPLGKKLNNSKTRAELGWEPKYPSFAQFLEAL
ncbi:UNVERIFIED_CONTAM: hypothetical protein Scaly_2952400 [Sesamum calycinum]|uniref:NAD(P)-binding Rossmann-fold superfamily protein n=1 Tax=Sesamum calycinum TaxID=2727403 RepID=A0AAW2KUG5_9LAMI